MEKHTKRWHSAIASFFELWLRCLERVWKRCGNDPDLPRESIGPEEANRSHSQKCVQTDYFFSHFRVISFHVQGNFFFPFLCNFFSISEAIFSHVGSHFFAISFPRSREKIGKNGKTFFFASKLYIYRYRPQCLWHRVECPEVPWDCLVPDQLDLEYS